MNSLRFITGIFTLKIQLEWIELWRGCKRTTPRLFFCVPQAVSAKWKKQQQWRRFCLILQILTQPVRWIAMKINCIVCFYARVHSTIAVNDMPEYSVHAKERDACNRSTCFALDINRPERASWMQKQNKKVYQVFIHTRNVIFAQLQFRHTKWETEGRTMRNFFEMNEFHEIFLLCLGFYSVQFNLIYFSIIHNKITLQFHFIFTIFHKFCWFFGF